MISHPSEQEHWHRLALIALSAAFLLVGVRWIWLYRYGQPFDIDEAGYLDIAFLDFHGLLRKGLSGWLSVVKKGGGPQAPLTTALASLVFATVGPNPYTGFIVVLLTATGAVIATYHLGTAVASSQVGLAASLLTACCPVVVMYSRSFHFSMPATLISTLALLAIAKSKRFSRLGWSLGFGLCLGSLPLARTMTIAFIPGLLCGAFISMVATPGNRSRRFAIFIAALITAGATAATWLAPNWQLVSQYLFGFGYGARAVEFGAEQSLFGWDAWESTLKHFCNSDVHLPHLLIILAGGLATLVLLSRSVMRDGILEATRQVIASPVLPIVIFVAEAWLALTSSRNKGSAFFAPLVPAMLVATCWALLALSRSRTYQRVLGMFMAVLVIVTAIPAFDLQTRFANPFLLLLYHTGMVVTDGRGTLQLYEANQGYGPYEVAVPMSKSDSFKWIELNSLTAEKVIRLQGQTTVVAFAFRNALYNVNTLNLAKLINSPMPFGVRQIEPILTGSSVEGYRNWLARDNPDICVLLTSDRAHGDFSPAINRALMREAAEQANFAPKESWPAPDGQIITLWEPNTPPRSCRID